MKFYPANQEDIMTLKAMLSLLVLVFLVCVSIGICYAPESVFLIASNITVGWSLVVFSVAILGLTFVRKLVVR